MVRSSFTVNYACSYKPDGEKFCYSYEPDEIQTVLNGGDFVIWLQVDESMIEYCFCLHPQTGRVLVLNICHLEIVDLEE